MSKTVKDGLARLQNQSRIPANVWRQWCNLLKLDPVDAVEVWEEICYPIMVATRKVPEVSFILQMRAARRDLDIFDFRDEAPKFLHMVTFLYTLRDPRLSHGPVKTSLLRLYRKMAAETGAEPDPSTFVQRFIGDLCRAILVAKVLPAEGITLTGVLKPVLDGRASMQQVVALGVKSLGERAYAKIVRECLTLAVPATGEEKPVALLEDTADADPDAAGDDPDSWDDDEDDEEGDIRDDEEGDIQGDGEEEEYEGGEFHDDESLLDAFLLRFKTALHAIYEEECQAVCAAEMAESSGAAAAEELLDDRLKAVTLFKPLHAGIPSIEEAQALARRAEVARSPAVLHTQTRTGSGTSTGAAAAGDGGGGSAGHSGGSGFVPGPLKAEDRQAMIARSRPIPPSGTASGGQEGDGSDSPVAVSVKDMVDPEVIAIPDINDRVQQIGRLLSSTEALDQTVWSLLLDPLAAIAELRAFTRTVSTPETSAQNAYQALKQVARCLPLKGLLHVSAQTVRRERSLGVEVRSFVNNVTNRRTFDADSKQLASLPRILDSAAAGLIRLEALRTNYRFAHEFPEEYTEAAVSRYFEEALRSLTDLCDADLRRSVRERADGDTRSLLAAFQLERLVERMLDSIREYALGLRGGEGWGSATDAQARMDEAPLEFADMERVNMEQIPAELLNSLELGEVMDVVYGHIATAAWAVLPAATDPPAVLGRIQELLREILVGDIVVKAEMRRHQEAPRVPLAVVSLERVTGIPRLREYYVRVGDDGRIAYLPDYEDGTYVDVFEQREYTPSRVHAASKKRAEAGEGEELQKGRKYLFTVGRTNKLFVPDAAALMDGCVRSQEGGARIFPLS